MLDFVTISVRRKQNGPSEVYPKFIIQKSNDLMIRGGDFYAVWVEERGLWSTSEHDVIELVDRELRKHYDNMKMKDPDFTAYVCYMRDAESGSIDAWHKYCQKQMRDCFVMLDEKLVFLNSETNKSDYASKRLPYPLEAGSIESYNKLISTLYSEEERHKIEWAIGAIVSGDSKTIQKFMVLYGAAGTGKSTILNIIQQLFEGYYSVFDAKALGSSNSSFALESFRSNPLVAIQHDGDLSRIEDNTRLNSLVSHEVMTVNEKFKASYENDFKAFLFMGTNKPVRITDGKSGLLRRLIDVTPSGNKLDTREYNRAVKQVKFELGAIAHHCQEVYLANKRAYDDYVPTGMMGATNDFYNYVIDMYSVFKRDNGTSLKAAWEAYKIYCEDAKVPNAFSYRYFKEELKNYFKEYRNNFTDDTGASFNGYYSIFRVEKFEDDMNPWKPKEPSEPEPEHVNSIDFQVQPSIFDRDYADCFAQYASSEETPLKGWDFVTTKLSSIDTSKLHYVRVPESHIVIDFDIKDENGNKCLEKNLVEASKWPATYAELSKSGGGIHLHYIYSGDVTKLSRIYDENIEIKVFTGKTTLRRKLTKCNDLPIAHISSGLPLKGDEKLVDWDGIKSEKMLRIMIKRNLNKEYHGYTKPSVDYIGFLLDDAYKRGIPYDVRDLKNDILAFAASSSNNADYCIKCIGKMKFKSEDVEIVADTPVYIDNGEEAPIVFYDVEVFPNLFLVNWKIAGEDKNVVRMINPRPADIEQLMKFRLIGFNCRRYDNHMLYACYIGYSNQEIYELSQKIVNAKKGENRDAFFGPAYNISYTDVYDFAAKKQSLKKWEIELGIHHQELGLDWDKPVPEDQWENVAAYCDNDVIATEAVFNHLKGDFTARQILADLAESSVNDTTNSLTGKIIFGKNKNPHNEFHYRNLAEPVYELDKETIAFLTETFPEMMAQRHGEAQSLLPYFPGYKYENRKSTYKNVDDVGEGGRVFARPGMWGDVALLDITSMHPHSTMAEVLFGPKFTRIFRDIVYGRVHIKHKAWEEVNQILDGKLTPYIQKVINGEMTSDELADALKIAINSVYGLTAASFDNLFKDPRNRDNIVAKRGALFMIDLQEAVEGIGYNVVHIKTDSIKISDATIDIINFVMNFGKRYGYSFEHEATYDRMCLVNNAVYIAKGKDIEWCEEHYGYIPSKQKKYAGKWTATGKQFQVPYTFKKLFTREPIEFEDLCETKEVKTALYLDMNEKLPEGEHDYHFVGKVGLFCPIKPGCGSGELRVERTDKDGNIKYDSATGADGYRWLEAEQVKLLGKENDIDHSYYDKLANDAIDAISEYGDFEWFVSDDPYIPGMLDVNPRRELEPVSQESPPWLLSCGRETCEGCPNFYKDDFHMSCELGHDIPDLPYLEARDEDARGFDRR